MTKLYRRKSTGEIHDGKGKVFGHFCGRCAGTGQFVTGSMNGKPTGPGGICFRCEGKGYQTPADEKRNFGYDNYAAGRAAHAMINDAKRVNGRGPDPDYESAADLQDARVGAADNYYEELAEREAEDNEHDHDTWVDRFEMGRY